MDEPADGDSDATNRAILERLDKILVALERRQTNA